MWPKRTKLLFRLDLLQTDLANFLSALSSLHQASAKEVVIAWWHSLVRIITWWRHQMEKLSALLTLCAGNSPVTGEFPAKRPVTRSFDISFDLHQIKRLSKHLRGWWCKTLSRPLWRHCNECEWFVLPDQFINFFAGVILQPLSTQQLHARHFQLQVLNWKLIILIYITLRFDKSSSGHWFR